MELCYVEGLDKVDQWLNDGYRKRWLRIYNNCKWSYPFSSLAFCEAWMQNYKSEWTPVIIYSLDKKGEITALFPLAFNQHIITGMGANQSEYHTPLALETDIQQFFNESFLLIRRIYPYFDFYLKYVDLNKMGALTTSYLTQHPHCILTSHRRPLKRLNLDDIEKSLNNKTNRKKFKSLNNRGEYNYERIEDVNKAVDLFKQMADIYDVRQGSQKNVCPFTDDSNKLNFHLQWIERDFNQTNLYVMSLNSRVIGALFCVNSNGVDSVAIIAFSPEFHKYSPSRLLVHLASKSMIENGIDTLDLTPGEDRWKDDFANYNDTVYELKFVKNSLSALIINTKNHLTKDLKGLLLNENVSPDHLKKLLRVIPKGPDKPKANQKQPEPYMALKILPDQLPFYKNPDHDFVKSDKYIDYRLICQRHSSLKNNKRKEYLGKAISRIQQGCIPVNCNRNSSTGFWYKLLNSAEAAFLQSDMPAIIIFDLFSTRNEMDSKQILEDFSDSVTRVMSSNGIKCIFLLIPEKNNEIHIVEKTMMENIFTINESVVACRLGIFL